MIPTAIPRGGKTKPNTQKNPTELVFTQEFQLEEKITKKLQCYVTLKKNKKSFNMSKQNVRIP